MSRPSNGRVAAHELGDMAQFLRTEEGLVALHAGDRVIFRRQWRIGGGVRRVENGTTGQVVAVDIERHVVTVRTDESEPRELEVSATEADPLLDLNYAAHVYKAQGATVDRTYVIAGGWQTHRESLYVACSRSRLGSHLFIDRESLGSDTDADALTAMAARGALSRGKVAATSLHSPAVARRARLAAAEAQAPGADQPKAPGRAVSAPPASFGGHGTRGVSVGRPRSTRSSTGSTSSAWSATGPTNPRRCRTGS